MTAWRKTRIVWLLLLSALAPFGEAMPRLLAADDTCGMSCCRKAKTCCCRKARPSTGWAAARTCPPGCGRAAMLPGLEVLATVPLTASPRPLSQTGCADGFHDYRDTARNARITGLQRPPPAC